MEPTETRGSGLGFVSHDGPRCIGGLTAGVGPAVSADRSSLADSRTLDGVDAVARLVSPAGSVGPAR